MLVADLVIFPLAETRSWSPWEDWVRVGVTILCMWRPAIGVPLATIMAGASPWLPASDYDKWLFIVPPCAAAFGGRRWLPWVSLLGPAVAFAVTFVDTGNWFTVPLWSPVALGVGLVANAAWRQAVRDEADLSDAIQERERLRLQERGRLAEELDRLMFTHLDAVGSELDREAAVDDVAALQRAVVRVDSSAQETLQLLRQAVGYLRDESDDAQTGSIPMAGLRERLEMEEDGLVGHGHGVELCMGELPPLNPVLVESVARVVGAAAAQTRRLAPAGSTVELTAIASSGEVTVTFSRLTSAKEPPDQDPDMDAAASRVRLVGGTVDTRSAAGRAITVVTVPRQVRADAAEPQPDGEPVSGRWMTAVDPRWFSLVLVALWLWPPLRAIYDLATGSEQMMANTVVDLVCYALAVVLIGLPAAQRVIMPILAVLLVLYAVTGWPLVAVMWLWLTAGGVAAARRMWFPQWMAMGFTFLLWHAIASGETWILVAYVQLSLLFIAGGLTIRYFLEHRARLLRALELERQELADVRLKERRLLAGELHDVVAHQLSLMTLQAAALADVVDVERLRGGLRGLADLNRSARIDLGFLHRVLEDGDNPNWSDSPRSAQAGLAAESALASAGFDAIVEVRPEVDGAVRPVRLTVVRLLRECSTNMLRYAPPRSRCMLRVWVNKSAVHFEALNPVTEGSAHNSPLATGVGLVGLAERIAALGGTFSAGEQAGQWVVSATLPLDPPAGD